MNDWFKIPNHIYAQVMKFREFLDVSSLEYQPKITNACYRTTNGTTNNIYSTIIWLKYCEYITKNVYPKGNFNLEKLKQEIPTIKNIMQSKDANTMYHELIEVFSSCGIVFRIVKNLKNVPIQGFIRKTKNNKIIMCMTIKRKWADIFWFTLFHEIAHILNGDLEKCNNEFIDIEDEEQSNLDTIEVNANEVATDLLINPNDYKSFIKQNTSLSIIEIQEFAKSQNIAPFIIIGRLQKEKLIPWHYYAKYKPKYEWA